MSNVIPLPWVEEVPAQTLKSIAQEVSDNMLLNISCLESMFANHPGLMSKHEEALTETLGRYFRIMAKISEYNGN